MLQGKPFKDIVHKKTRMANVVPGNRVTQIHTHLRGI
jgi:hypothetical protein